MNDDYEDEEFENKIEEESVDRQEMNLQAWKMLVGRGFVPGHKMRLDFVFVTETRANAQKLKNFFEAETDYTIKVVNNDDEFEIDGQTSEIPLTLEGINQWVNWLVEEGRKRNCIFDGWTAPLMFKKKSS